MSASRVSLTGCTKRIDAEIADNVTFQRQTHRFSPFRCDYSFVRGRANEIGGGKCMYLKEKKEQTICARLQVCAGY